MEEGKSRLFQVHYGEYNVYSLNHGAYGSLLCRSTAIGIESFAAAVL